jgi:hypothetical protein
MSKIIIDIAKISEKFTWNFDDDDEFWSDLALYNLQKI